MPRGPDLSVFERAGWLAETPAVFREAVLARSDVIEVAPGKMLYQAGDDGGGLFGVLEGRVEVHIPPHGDSPTLMHIVGPGFWTGEFAAVTGGTRRIALIARTPCGVLRLTRAELLRIADAVPQCWQMMSVLAVRNVAVAINLIEALKRDDPMERVALTLVNLARETTGVPILIDASQTDLGAIARLSRGSVSAALGRLEFRGLIRRTYGAVEIGDLRALTDYVHGHDSRRRTVPP